MLEEDPRMVDIGVVLKRFEDPDETRHLELGTFDVMRIGGMTIGRGEVNLVHHT